MQAAGPLRELGSWEAGLLDGSGDEEALEAMLLTAGEKGYAAASAREVAARVGTTPDRFQRRFGDKEACFAQSYEAAVERLAARLDEACRGGADWRESFRAGLAELLRFVAERPFEAKALVLEVRAARGRAWAKHQECVERVSAAIETAREQPGGRPGPSSPMTAAFIAGAIEESIAIELAAGRAEQVERLLPDLTHLAFLQLFGEE
jgi:AcrR family transcriptional regulator